MNKKIIAEMTQEQILNMTTEDVARIFMDKPWNHPGFMGKIRHGKQEVLVCRRCGNSDSTPYCTSPPPLDRSLADIMIEVVAEVWPGELALNIMIEVELRVNRRGHDMSGKGGEDVYFTPMNIIIAAVMTVKTSL